MANGDDLLFLVRAAATFVARRASQAPMCYTGTSKRRVMENSNALDNPVSDRCRAAWRSPGGVGGALAQLSMVRQLRSAPWQCDGLPFHQSPSVRGDGVRDSRALLSKSALSLGTRAPTPHQLTRRSRRGSPGVRPSVPVLAPLLRGFSYRGPPPAAPVCCSSAGICTGAPQPWTYRRSGFITTSSPWPKLRSSHFPCGVPRVSPVHASCSRGRNVTPRSSAAPPE
jgi:hypothetical protein